VKYYYEDTGHTRSVTLRGVVIVSSFFAFGYAILTLLQVYISSKKDLIWKMLVIMIFASIPAGLSAWDCYVKEYAYSGHAVRDTMLQFFILFFLITLMFSIPILYAEYRKRKERNHN
jgi:hypothetical protein